MNGELNSYVLRDMIDKILRLIDYNLYVIYNVKASYSNVVFRYCGFILLLFVLFCFVYLDECSELDKWLEQPLIHNFFGKKQIKLLVHN